MSYKTRSGITRTYATEKMSTEEEVRLTRQILKARIGTNIEVSSSWTYEPSSVVYRVTGTPKKKELVEIRRENWEYGQFEPDSRVRLDNKNFIRGVYDRLMEGDTVKIKRTALTAQEKKAIRAEEAAERRQYKFKF